MHVELRRPLTTDGLDDALPLRLTLVLLLLRPPEPGVLRGATWLLAVAMLVVPALLRSSYAWLGMGALVALRVVQEFPLADNHIYLLCYWCLALGLVHAVADSPAERAPLLGDASRWLIAGAFVCAVIWKGLLSAEFLDGRFFRVTLLVDDRFASLAQTAGGLDAAQLAQNRLALDPIPADVELLSGPTLVEPVALRVLAGALTWMGFTCEALIAAAFVLPRPRWLVRLRHPALWLFCVATYAIAPVAGFGWLLASMGMAHANDGRGGTAYRILCIGYAAAFVLVLIYAETPSVEWLLDGAAALRRTFWG